jgi:hypothetical protein
VVEIISKEPHSKNLFGSGLIFAAHAFFAANFTSSLTSVSEKEGYLYI